MGRRSSDGKITGLSVWDGSPASAPPVRWSEVAPPVVPRQTIVAVEVATGTSTETGVAALTHYAEPGRTASALEVEELLPVWLGFPIRALPHHPWTHNAYEPWTNPMGPAIALAALDALGRATQLPAATFLGGVCRSKIPAYASLPSFPDAGAAVACAASALDAGFRTVKFHGSGMLDVDLETISKARSELGASTQLIWDASRAYELHSAEVIGKALVEEGFLWFEAPLEDDSVAALYRLARRLQISLVPDGMAQRSAGDWARDLRDDIWGALRLDLTRAGSLSAAMRVVRLAESWGVPCEIQSFGFPLSQYANLQLMLATPACRFFEAPFPETDFHDGLVTPPSIEEGFVTIPDPPGLGHDMGAERFFEACELLARLTA